MKFIDIYYHVKPAIPRRVQITVRRVLAAHKRKVSKNVWPIDPHAAGKPEGWTGWPENKTFALVLQHDVDTKKGLEKCPKLMDLEKRTGFRSAFNFVPEDYLTPRELRRSLSESGFEIGVHGLKHDGKLFKHPSGFFVRAPKIGYYLKNWGAVGFTSPSMLRNLSLMVELNIEHGCSTFDTDPFEPQSDGMGTIFPFNVSNASGTRTYVELPYTLPQDHCLFVILNEKDNRIWKEKLDWIAESGGMALLNTHPDYMNFDGGRYSLEEYPVSYYQDLLEHVQIKYAGQYWHALPRDMARFWKLAIPADTNRKITQDNALKHHPKAHKDKAKIWIDLDNTPHVPFFIPIIRELERRGHKVVLTARDAFQVCELAEEKGLPITKIGHHYGKNPILKIAGLFRRSEQLYKFARFHRPDIALSHGARSQVLLCKLLGIPTIVIADYEHARTLPFARPLWLLVPEALSIEDLPLKFHHIRQYPGIKEDVYVPTFNPDPSILDELGLGSEIIVAVRPPADEAHYYNPESTVLFLELMSRVCQTPGIKAVLLPRNKGQEQTLLIDHPEWFAESKTIIPARALDGLNLLWFSDLVVSGGGTMNREAAALAVPVYSIFRGKIGAVDSMLEREGRLVMIRTVEEVWSKILFESRNRDLLPDNQVRPAFTSILDNIENIVEIERANSRGQGKRGSFKREADE
jgi:predicted glycosyltransferase